MTEERAKRKLAAIFSADVKGYSRLMADDEEATVRTITAYRDVITGIIKEHRGRVADAKGDNVLAEFSSVVDAVRCAVGVQKELKGRSDDKSQEYFSDGLAEEIINALVKLPQVFVIARNSSFTYKGKSVDVKQVGRELGVQYILSP